MLIHLFICFDLFSIADLWLPADFRAQVREHFNVSAMYASEIRAVRLT